MDEKTKGHPQDGGRFRSRRDTDRAARAGFRHAHLGRPPAGLLGPSLVCGGDPLRRLGLRELRKRSEAFPHFKPLVGLVGAAVFLISCMPIPVPTAGTCSHPSGTGLAAILIGPGLTVVVASIALTLQALFLAHGGLTTLGANIVSMGVAGAYVGYGTYWITRRLGLPWVVAAFLAGLFSDWATYAMTAFELAAALPGAGSFRRCSR